MVKRVDIIELLEKTAKYLRDYEDMLLDSRVDSDVVKPVTLLIDALDQMTLDLGDTHVSDVL